MTGYLGSLLVKKEELLRASVKSQRVKQARKRSLHGAPCWCTVQAGAPPHCMLRLGQLAGVHPSSHVVLAHRGGDFS